MVDEIKFILVECGDCLSVGRKYQLHARNHARTQVCTASSRVILRHRIAHHKCVGVVHAVKHTAYLCDRMCALSARSGFDLDKPRPSGPIVCVGWLVGHMWPI